MKFKIYLEYNGTNYAGWQQQKNAKTVQGTLIDAVKTIFKKSKGESRFIDLQGSGRTDRGVHAREQVAHLECETMLGPEIIKMKLNDILPSDINILEVEKTHNRFHARHSAEARQYIYVISKRRTAFEKRFVWWVKDKLNVKKMSEAGKLFEGMHDFGSFCEKSEEDKSTKVNVEFVNITEDTDKIYIRIKSSHFLWKMVRRLVGVLVEVGRGNMNENDIKGFLKNYTDGLAIYTAPPSGLFLEKIFY
ncbi:MAG: tRNA pseudouridine(38-40) synthase TruA [Ignavibacteria bacterium]